MNKLSSKQKEEIQVLIHYVGFERFCLDLSQILFSASDDVEDIDISLADNYRELANLVGDFVETKRTK